MKPFQLWICFKYSSYKDFTYTQGLLQQSRPEIKTSKYTILHMVYYFTYGISMLFLPQ